MAGIEAHAPLWLLLLPSPPFNVSSKAMRAVYGPPLTQALRKVSKTSTFATVALLDIAIACPELLSDLQIPRTSHYANLQRLFGQMYKLICLICMQESIDAQFGNDVDARVLLFNGDTENSLKEATEAHRESYLFEGPIVSLQALALCQRPWQYLCVTDDHEGDVLLSVFQRLRKTWFEGMEQKLVIERLHSGSEMKTAIHHSPQNSSAGEAPLRRHYSVAVGGTFDHLHAGHKLLLTMTALVLELFTRSGDLQNRTLTIGITGDKLLKKKEFADVLQSWDKRQACVRQFLLSLHELSASAHAVTPTKHLTGSDTLGKAVQDELKSGLTIKYVELFDAFGPTITDEAISALVVSGETRAGGKAVNDERKNKGWSTLQVFEVDVLDAEDKDDVETHADNDGFLNKISSTDIRRRLHDGPKFHPGATN